MTGGSGTALERGLLLDEAPREHSRPRRIVGRLRAKEVFWVFKRGECLVSHIVKDE